MGRKNGNSGQTGPKPSQNQARPDQARTKQRGSEGEETRTKQSGSEIENEIEYEIEVEVEVEVENEYYIPPSPSDDGETPQRGDAPCRGRSVGRRRRRLGGVKNFFILPLYKTGVLVYNRTKQTFDLNRTCTCIVTRSFREEIPF